MNTTMCNNSATCRRMGAHTRSIHAVHCYVCTDRHGIFNYLRIQRKREKVPSFVPLFLLFADTLYSAPFVFSFFFLPPPLISFLLLFLFFFLRLTFSPLCVPRSQEALLSVFDISSNKGSARGIRSACRRTTRALLCRSLVFGDPAPVARPRR